MSLISQNLIGHVHRVIRVTLACKWSPSRVTMQWLANQNLINDVLTQSKSRPVVTIHWEKLEQLGDKPVILAFEIFAGFWLWLVVGSFTPGSGITNITLPPPSHTRHRAVDTFALRLEIRSTVGGRLVGCVDDNALIPMRVRYVIK